MPLIVNAWDKDVIGGNFIHVPEKELILVYSGVFSFKYLYFLLHEYFIETKYCSVKESEFKEHMFSRRDTARGREIQIIWRLSKDTGDYYYTRYEFDLIFHALALQETEVLIGGKKMKLDKGEIELKIKGRIMQNPDVDNAWYMKNKRVNKWYKKKYLIDKRNFHKKQFRDELAELQESIKEYFDIERYLQRRGLLEYFKGRMGE